MKLSLESYRNKVMGCWMGKNIGGTLGAPFECKRQINDVTFYAQDVDNNPPANDDLDLQLIWLNAIEKYGRRINASILGEYWLSFITPHWVEYGAGKTNMRMGIVPPLSGYLNNPYRDSCGCFIRSEVWACIAPGHPDIAVKYAYEDGIVDHSNEGLYGEIFFAAIESAAFVESDRDKLINIGLSYIPEDCGIAKGVRAAVDSYRDGLSWMEARKKVMTAVPGTFGLIRTFENLPEDIPIGERGYDAPSNVAITILGWIYGGDDFGESICTAVNCGEDTDCTAATLGSIWGIIHGYDGIPEVWKKPMGDRINTMCLNFLDGVVSIPGTISELTDRVLKLTPIFLGGEICDFMGDGYTIDALEGEGLYNKPVMKNYWIKESFGDTLKRQPFSVKYEFVIFDAVLDYCGEPFIKENNTKTFILTLSNNIGRQQWVNIKWHTPDGWKVSPGKNISTYLDHNDMGKTMLEFTLETEVLSEARYDLLVEISSNGHHSKGIIPIVLLKG
ncbi:ADP-ribosylglycohydrolase [Peptococcaceae bacterium CEB3]|nr:ADP-ribosylglycohydrolase [Peptococcaceae bacterium CEB3]